MTRAYDFDLEGSSGKRLDLDGNSWFMGWNCDTDSDGEVSCKFWYLATSRSGDKFSDWQKISWPDPSRPRQMYIKDLAGNINTDGSPFLVVIGEDNALLYRIGNASNDFALGAKSWGFFTWVPTEPDPRMKSKEILDVTRNSSGLIQVSVIGGDGKTCNISQTKLNEASFSGWSCS